MPRIRWRRQRWRESCMRQAVKIALCLLVLVYSVACSMHYSQLRNFWKQGNAAYDQSDYHEALISYKKGYRLSKTTGSPRDTSIFATNLGRVAVKMGQYADARRYLEEALAIDRELGNGAGEVTALGHLGILARNLGQNAEARRYFEQALAIAQLIRDREREAAVWGALGGVSADFGEYSDAQRYIEKSYAIYRELENSDGEQRALHNLGAVALELGQHADARRYLEQALANNRMEGNRAGEWIAMNNLGVLAGDLGQYTEAKLYYEQVLLINRKSGNRMGESTALGNLGSVAVEMGQYADARRYLEEALAIDRELGARRGEAYGLEGLGDLATELGQYAEARRYYEHALAIAEEVGDPRIRWEGLKGLQESHMHLAQMPTAIFFGKQAVNTIQAIRRRLVNMESDYQRSFVENKRYVYEELADLLIGEGRLWEAQQVLAMLKEEEYFDFIRRRTAEDPRENKATFTQPEQPWLERYQTIRQTLIQIATDYQNLRQKQRAVELNLKERQRLAELDYDLTIARKAFSQYFSELQVAFETLGGKKAVAFGKKDLDSLRGFQGTLQRLGHGTVLLHFLPTDEQLHIILTSANSALAPIAYKSPTRRAELNRLIYAYREILQDPRRDPSEVGGQLYHAIFSPIVQDLINLKAETLLVYLDGTMRYLPLAALYDGEHYVAESYAVVMYTVAAKAEIRTNPVPEWRVAGLGLSQGVPGFKPLPAVEAELDGIIKDETNQDDAQGVLPGRMFLNDQFTATRLQTVLSDSETPYPVIHLASHFRFRPGSEVDSFLLLGKGNHLTLAELKEGDYPMTYVDLLTLSACETGLGGEKQDGSEVEGFGVLAQNQGAKSVLATLWKVADRSTGKFMQQLYKLRQEKKLTKAEALRRVQELFIRGDLSHRYSHPYYWAPFILMGNFL